MFLFLYLQIMHMLVTLASNVLNRKTRIKRQLQKKQSKMLHELKRRRKRER